MPQVGIYSAYQLGLHNHLDDTNGGILNEYSRYGAYRETYRTGALAVHVDNDAPVVNGGPAGYRLMKQFTVVTAQLGEFRISWRMKNDDGATTVNTKFYVNGVAVSAAQSSASNVYSTKTYNYDVNLAAGDLLQIWGDSTTDIVYVDQFRIYYDWCIKYFGAGSVMVLSTPLTLADVTALDLTADF